MSDYFTSIAQTADGGYILGGISSSNISGDKTENSNGDWDFWIVKTDSLGVIQWQNTIGGNDKDDTLFNIANFRWRVYTWRIFQFQYFRR